MSAVHEIFKAISIVVLLWLANDWAAALGSLLYALTALTMRIPRLGRVFRFIINGPLYVGVVSRLIGMTIGAAGPLLGLYVYSKLFGKPTQPYEFWVILLSSVNASLKIIHSIFLFRLGTSYSASSRDILAWVVGGEKNGALSALKGEWLPLVTSNFVSMHLPQFLRFFVNVGFVYWGLASLHLVPAKAGGSLSLIDAEQLSFAVLQVIDKPATMLSGPLYEGIRITATFITMFWLVMFVSLSSSIVNRDANLTEGALDLAKPPAEVTESETDSTSVNTSGPGLIARRPTLETDESAVELPVVSSQTGSGIQGRTSLDQVKYAGTKNSGDSIPTLFKAVPEMQLAAVVEESTVDIGTGIETTGQPSQPAVLTESASAIVQIAEYTEGSASINAPSVPSEVSDCEDDRNRGLQNDDLRPGTGGANL